MKFLFLLESTDWVSEGLTALISGMVAVFSILILISFIISLFRFIKTGDIKHEPHKEARINAVIEKKDSTIDELELVAVITAAIAASLNTTTDQLQVKSFRRINRSNRFNR